MRAVLYYELMPIKNRFFYSKSQPIECQEFDIQQPA